MKGAFAERAFFVFRFSGRKMVRGRAPYNWIWIFQKIVKFRGALNRDSSLGRPNARLGKTNKMILLGAVEQTAKWFSNGPECLPSWA
jgi:hypothetical protein